jgi:AcrR family transcriptional regulator
MTVIHPHPGHPTSGVTALAKARGRQAANTGTSEETRGRIVDATIETLRTEGIVGASARAIARTGGFNQALIYYHFGSIDEVLVASLAKMGAERKARYESALDEVTTLPELAQLAAELHKEDTAIGNITVLTQILAGAAHDPELGPRVFQEFEPWTAMVDEAIRKVVKDSPFEDSLPVEDLALAVSATFLGIELLTHLDPNPDREDSLFRSIGLIAVLVDAVLTSGVVPRAADELDAARAVVTQPNEREAT